MLIVDPCPGLVIAASEVSTTPELSASYFLSDLTVYRGGGQMMETWKTNLGRVIPRRPKACGCSTDQDPMSSSDPNCGLWWSGPAIIQCVKPPQPSSSSDKHQSGRAWYWTQWVEVFLTRKSEHCYVLGECFHICSNSLRKAVTARKIW